MSNTWSAFNNSIISTVVTKYVSLFLLVAACVVLVSANAAAEWRVDFESKGVSIGETGVTVDVIAYWDLTLTGLTVPVIVRELDAGSFWAGASPYDTGGNAFFHPYVQGVTWGWVAPWASLTEEIRPAVPTAPCPTNGDVGYDGVSPDHFSINTASAGGGSPAEPTGRSVVTTNRTLGSHAHFRCHW